MNHFPPHNFLYTQSLVSRLPGVRFGEVGLRRSRQELGRTEVTSGKGILQQLVVGLVFSFHPGIWGNHTVENIHRQNIKTLVPGMFLWIITFVCIVSFNIYSHPVRYVHNNCCHSLSGIEKNEAHMPKQLARGLMAGWAVWLIVTTPNVYGTRKTPSGTVLGVEVQSEPLRSVRCEGP